MPCRAPPHPHTDVEGYTESTDGDALSTRIAHVIYLFIYLSEFQSANLFVCLCWCFTAQSTQWSHVERGRLTCNIVQYHKVMPYCWAGTRRVLQHYTWEDSVQTVHLHRLVCAFHVRYITRYCYATFSVMILVKLSAFTFRSRHSRGLICLLESQRPDPFYRLITYVAHTPT